MDRFSLFNNDILCKRKKKSMAPYYIYTGIVFIFAMVVLVSVR